MMPSPHTPLGAKKAYIYLRDEYRYLLKGLESAISQAGEKGYLKDLDH